MGKLQQIKRVNGSIVSSINLQLEDIEALGWPKGEELEFDRLTVAPGVTILMVFKSSVSGKVRGFFK